MIYRFNTLKGQSTGIAIGTTSSFTTGGFIPISGFNRATCGLNTYDFVYLSNTEVGYITDINNTGIKLSSDSALNTAGGEVIYALRYNSGFSLNFTETQDISSEDEGSKLYPQRTFELSYNSLVGHYSERGRYNHASTTVYKMKHVKTTTSGASQGLITTYAYCDSTDGSGGGRLQASTPLTQPYHIPSAAVNKNDYLIIINAANAANNKTYLIESASGSRFTLQSSVSVAENTDGISMIWCPNYLYANAAFYIKDEPSFRKIPNVFLDEIYINDIRWNSTTFFTGLSTTVNDLNITKMLFDEFRKMRLI